ncbi:hypothetical protein Peur_052939 [Populus x canadensis]
MALSSMHFLDIRESFKVGVWPCPDFNGKDQRRTTTRITGLVKLARAHCILFTLGNSEGYKYKSSNTRYIFTCACELTP